VAGLQGSYAGSDEGADEVTKPGLKPGTVLMTQQRRELIKMLGGSPGGLLKREVVKATGQNDKAVAARLSRAKADNLIVSVGNGTQTLWGLKENIGKMRMRLSALKVASYKRELKLNRGYNAVRRALKPKRRIPNSVRKQQVMPAVNSVWALAA
jgi:hypothetical protein